VKNNFINLLLFSL